MAGHRHHDWPLMGDVVAALLTGCTLVRIHRPDGRITSFVDAPDRRHSLVGHPVHGATVGALLYRRWIVVVAERAVRERCEVFALNSRGRLLGALQQQGLAPRD